MPPCDRCEATGEHFCTPRADKAQNFFEKVLVHTRGRFAGKPFILTDWQRDDIIRPVFGNVKWDEQSECYVRTYKTVWIEVARKNGKSELLAGVALFMLCADGEESAEVYGAAKDRDQAALVYSTAKRMVEMSPVLSKRLTIVDSRKRIIDPTTNSIYQVLAADAGGNLGLNPSCIVFDEVLTQPNRDLWDALRTGMGARVQPMLLAATTAGNDLTSFAYEEHQYCERVLEDPSIDPTRFVYMRNVPKDADWRDESLWDQANPALGDFLSFQTLRDEAKEAETKPSAQNSFRQFRLNQWVSQANRWLDMGIWDECAGLLVIPPGALCYAGLDLASTTDFTAWVMIFPDGDGGFKIKCRFWIPRAALEKRPAMLPVFSAWERDGWLTVTEGATVDYQRIMADISEDAETYNIKGFAYDPWNALQLVQDLEERGLTAVKYPQTLARMNGPSKELERLLGLRQITHGGNPVLRWHADNVELATDAEGNIKPSKKKSTEKIDGIVALVMAVAASQFEYEPAPPTANFFSLEDFGED